MPILPNTSAAGPSGPGFPMQNTGLHSRTPSQKPGPSPQPTAADLTYVEPILSRPVKVRIDAGIPRQTQILIQAKTRRATALINLAASKLTDEQKEIIHLLRAIVIVPAKLPSGAPTTIRTGIDVFRGLFTLLDTYVTAPGVTPSFFASDLAHDSFHIWQHLHGKDNTPQDASSLEREADDFQITVGRFFGLTEANIEYLKNDTHTFYNTGKY